MDPTRVRYWAASGRPGADTAFDTGQMRVGRRLSIKILNASKFVLANAEPRGPVTHSVDRGLLTRLAQLIDETTADLAEYNYTKALERTEGFFWAFCDHYLELVKARRYGDHGDEGAASANSAMQITLDVLLRLFAPYLPFVTEDVWSWWREGSVHQAAWPVSDDIVSRLGVRDADAERALGLATDILGDIRKKKSEGQKSMRTPVTRVAITLPDDMRGLAGGRQPRCQRVGARAGVGRHQRRRPGRHRRRTGRTASQGACGVIGVTPLDPGLCREHVRRALAEDLGWGDVTTDALVAGDRRARGCIVATQPALVAGVGLAEEAFRQLDPLATVGRRVPDGTKVAAGDVVLEVSGSAGAMLTAERTARNFVNRLTGIATLTEGCVAAARGCLVRSSRDTTPGLRALEHYAVRVGGGAPYRAALDAGVVATANHVRFAPGFATAVRQVLALQADLPTSVEVRTPDEIDVALEAGARRLIFGPDWAPACSRGSRAFAGGRPSILIVLGADHLASLPDEALRSVSCVVVPGLTASATPAGFVFVVDPERAGGA